MNIQYPDLFMFQLTSRINIACRLSLSNFIIHHVVFISLIVQFYGNPEFGGIQSSVARCSSLSLLSVPLK